MSKTTKAYLAGLALAVGAGIGPAQAVDEITVAYFLEWPTPNQFAQAKEIYEAILRRAR